MGIEKGWSGMQADSHFWPSDDTVPYQMKPIYRSIYIYIYL